MINEQILDAKFAAPNPPRHKPKTEESSEIERLVQEYLAKGGTIKTATGNSLDKKQTFAISNDAATVWPYRNHVLKIMREKYISQMALRAKIKISKKLLQNVLAGEQLPDAQERAKILEAVENWGVKL